MKKIYSLLIASAVAVSAAAPASAVSHNVSRKEKKNEVPAFPNQVSLAPMSQTFRQMRKADANPTLEGYWTMYFGDFYDPNGEIGFIPVTFLATVNGNNVTFTPKMDSNRFYEFQAVFNPEDNSLTISKKMLSVINGGYFFQVPCYYDVELEDLIDLNQIVGKYDPFENKIMFEPDLTIAWGVYKNAMGSEIDYDLAIFDINSGYLFNPYKALEGNWEVIGNAQFEDPWLVPALGLNPTENIYDVQFEQDMDNPTRFRLVNPYKQGPVAKWNGSEGGYITFDIKDHEHVLFLPTDAGFVNTAILPGGISSFYCYNALGYEVVNQPVLSVEEVIENYTYIPFTKYDSAQNKVILSYVEEGGQRAYDANFGYQSVPLGGNFWDGVSMAGSITFPSWFNAAVGAVEVDESNAPVEYFNLNGVRVSNPEKGQIVIKRQGSKVSKVIL